MENDFGKYTRERVSDLPFDYNDPAYEQCKEKVLQFTGQAAYIYSFEKKRMLFANGWEELLGYKDKDITLLKIISITSERYFDFSGPNAAYCMMSPSFLE